MDRRATAWAASGAMALSGRSDGPGLGASGALVDLVERAAAMLHRNSGGRVTSAGLALLGERAAIENLTRQGAISCGGSTRLLRAADGWLAVSLAREDDVAALPAWLQVDLPFDDPWPAVTEAVAGRPVAGLDERAALLGLPFAALDSVSVAAPALNAFDLPVAARRVDEDAVARPRPIAGATVLDLSALWAGPLCGQLLAEAGANVIKLESITRPDGARRGPAPFFSLLNGEKRSVALDLVTPDGRRAMDRLLTTADVVIESARPRALEQWGIVASDVLVRRSGPQVWVSITSHGRGLAVRERVGFGDVAAVAGGLVTRDDRGPCFVADAVTDPVTGLVSAAAVVAALATGHRWLLSAAMAPLAASVAGPPLDVAGLEAAPPRARPARRRAPVLGADTVAVLAEVGF
ncbi:MAG TPA: CoA transferase [Acidimicrobiales bacterium]|jgi:hypothetical protein|nr:CoA transferase [Acidimicrobiales bacterium]